MIKAITANAGRLDPTKRPDIFYVSAFPKKARANLGWNPLVWFDDEILSNFDSIKSA
jgi:hypothetical protein